MASFNEIDGIPATANKWLLTDVLRKEWGYDGVVITDALMMKAIFERYGYDRAAVMALQAGADMVLAQGSLEEQAASVQALATAFGNGALSAEQGLRARARLDALAAAYPVRHDDYAAEARADDDQLMRRAWACGLTALGEAKAPALAQRLRVYTQASVPGDGVSEAGPSGERVAALFEGFADVELLALDNIDLLDWAQVPQDGRFTILASNHRARYPAAAAAWRPDLHLVLWNPFQALDVTAPTVVTWGYADGALAALKAWLQGDAAATATSPVALTAA